ncbi:MAG: phosphoribosylanthranilate isomerase [Gammaproteobacteria bacterium]|nr:phosphoribosylanthranilate isomerase [Gammaproteobacteria bacterium]NIR83091.1 phosphoribosylanthranilate isomerase [Gammaproteobacteria bacterium]NIR90753.1 phosphoribosylanthranilate isomerase [Gammaproteobacteria bacterium]NIU04244.1 phosphoribosylanthranilate isomerase [Gammaproteobacteria bacterium]NIV51536.1 phosphoribosylanthranilate isomerase [Gammaproteobacteria bacterium]
MPRRPRVKICGVTRPEDARRAAALGADAVGLVFYPPSPRAVSVEQAQAITHALPPFVCAVAVFLDAEPAAVRDVLGSVRVHLLQFHGEESAEECERYGPPYIKAVRVGAGGDVLAYARRHARASGFLLDTYHHRKPGGTGLTFDWSLVPRELDRPVILAGGLTAENVGEAVERVRPYGVDVSTGVESVPGIKDAAKLEAFMRGIDRVGAAETQS